MSKAEQTQKRTFCIMFNRLPEALRTLTLGQYFSLNAKIVGRIIGLRLFENENVLVKLEEVEA